MVRPKHQSAEKVSFLGILRSTDVHIAALGNSTLALLASVSEVKYQVF